MGIMMTEMRGLHVPLNPEEFYVLSLDCSPFCKFLKKFFVFSALLNPKLPCCSQLNNSLVSKSSITIKNYIKFRNRQYNLMTLSFILIK